MPKLPLTQFEIALWQTGIDYIAGVDEVGRGSLAGPLVVGAVILNKQHLLTNSDVAPEIFELYAAVDDSKKLSPRKREQLAKFIKNQAMAHAIFEIPPHEIDKFGIAQATQNAFFGSIRQLAIKPQHILTDTFAIKEYPEQIQTNIIKGDQKSITIAAASIVAKVYRDNLMVEYHKIYKNYCFDAHKGYGTKRHKEAIEKYGPCDLHRKSFEPIRSYLQDHH